MAVFGYGRVSTSDQTSENQRREIEEAGYRVEHWYADEGISGKTPATSRPQFQKLRSYIRPGETLVVSKLDRLGRDSLDVEHTLRDLEAQEIRVIVLQLGATDLTSTAGKLIRKVLAAVADMERDLIKERTQAGLARAKAEGKSLGRPAKLIGKDQRREVLEMLSEGKSLGQTAEAFGISRAYVAKIKKEATLQPS
ncbi:recombinase family protein [Thauera sp. 63]|uniref:recombinase family protein n=1 Tax=Thauera sp. 63 TaxID=497321 RepID=UPI00056ECAE0|nr:recombinase family protein [Thauera sp. 63]